jgi:release factor glutamine methyltransferase
MAEERRRWTIIELLKWTADYLKEKQFENGRLTGERLLAHVLQCRRVDLYVQFERPLSGEELASYKALLKRRLAHEPVQYIIGETEFFSLPFKVGPGVLIPRPETELLVEKVLAAASPWPEARILDIGTGSGNIATSLAVHLPSARITAVDCSQAALHLAAENGQRNKVAERIQWQEWNLFSDTCPLQTPFDIVVANPPYIRQADYDALPLEIKNFEPANALLAGLDGLDAYKAICKWLPTLLNKPGFAYLEIGADQANGVAALFTGAVIHKDLAGKDRIIEFHYQ